MRPPATSQSAFRAPLNHLLGTEGGVRLLRVLAGERSGVGAGELARRTMLTPAATRRALAALVDTGLVEVAGVTVGRYTLRRAHPLAPALVALFDAERIRAESVLEGIKRAIGQLTPPPVAAWIEGAAATGTDDPGEPILVRLVSPASTLRGLVHRLGEALRPVEESLDVTIDVAGATPADLAGSREAASRWEPRLRDALGLAGLPPSAYLPRPATKAAERSRRRTLGHGDADAGALAIARAVAERLKKDPSLISRAREFVERRLRNASPGERHELDEWRQLLETASPARIRRFLVDKGERATRLRQTLPFLGVLSPEERDALLDAASDAADSGGDA